MKTIRSEATKKLVETLENAVCHEYMRLEEVRNDRRRLGLDTAKAEEAMADMAEAMRWIFANL